MVLIKKTKVQRFALRMFEFYVLEEISMSLWKIFWIFFYLPVIATYLQQTRCDLNIFSIEHSFDTIID